MRSLDNPASAIPSGDTGTLRRFGFSGPRYTSYPTADRFVEAFDASAFTGWLNRRNIGGVNRPLSLYVHIPFCESICYYCACNKIVTRDRTKAQKYSQYLLQELDLLQPHLGEDRRVTQLHLGGGTPTYLSDADMRLLLRAVRKRFELAPRGEYSIEVDPRTTDAARIGLLAELGFNRMSIGVQDFDPRVQRAVNRIQPEEKTLETLQAARASGFQSVNFDLMYGLPRQTVETFERTLERVVAAAPDRIALYNYAHLPEVFKPQRRILEEELPDPDARVEIFLAAVRALTRAGYVHIGLDHFAKPSDELTVAYLNGRLHRNFQGYSTQSDCDLLSIGVSAISKIGPCYAQNVRALDEYYDSLERERLPVMRGLELSRDDLARRAVIMALMCHGGVCVESIEIAHLIDFGSYFARELEELECYAELGLVNIAPDWISVTPEGRLVVRAICMVFDRYLRAERDRSRYSRVI
jgi:oxygen-independent coproporphyrinogen-3 oxidase